MKIPCLLSEARVAITPMGKIIRFGGTMEIGKMDNKINMNRVEGIVDSVNEYFPNMNLGIPEKENIWYGYRPCSPDGLPYLGFTKKYKNLIIAGGHSMMGLSLAPATGKLVAQLAAGEETKIDISIFKPDRF
ncbi:MAG: FAD-binding oxidoreductase [Pedobacter sp.]|nr:FAD-binding oxidoreductase [Pedobacter sp.]